MHPVLIRLLDEAPILTDGAWGTQMQQRGLPVGSPPDPWNLAHPDRVLDVARAYVKAGSRIILTNTFGASRITLDRHGLANEARQINCAGAEISRQAAADRALVFGSIGPTGKLVAMGEITAEEANAAFEEQVAGLAEGGVDSFVIETMSDLDEAAIAVRCAAATGLPVVACMTYGAGKSGDRTIMGTTPEQAAEALLAAGAHIVGTNCGHGPAAMRPIVERLRQVSGQPVWAKPNAGLPTMVDGRAVYAQTPTEFVEEAVELIRAGAAFVGGCCGTGPEFIRELARRLQHGA